MNQLIWAKYLDGSTSPKYLLLLEVGPKNGLFGCLIADRIPQKDIEYIKKNADLYASMSSAQRSEWLKKHCPDAVTAYRTLSPAKLVVVKTYPLKNETKKPTPEQTTA